MKLPPELRASLKKAMTESYGERFTDDEIELIGVELVECFTMAIGTIVAAKQQNKFDSHQPSTRR